MEGAGACDGWRPWKWEQPLWKPAGGVLRTPNTGRPNRPTAPPLGVCLGEAPPPLRCPVFAAAASTTATTWKRPTCPSTEERRKTGCCSGRRRRPVCHVPGRGRILRAPCWAESQQKTEPVGVTCGVRARGLPEAEWGLSPRAGAGRGGRRPGRGAAGDQEAQFRASNLRPGW